MPDVTSTLASVGIATTVVGGLAALARGSWVRSDRAELRETADDLRKDIEDRDRRLDEKDRVILEKIHLLEAAEEKARVLARTVTAEAAIRALTDLLTAHADKADANTARIMAALATIREAISK